MMWEWVQRLIVGSNSRPRRRLHGRSEIFEGDHVFESNGRVSLRTRYIYTLHLHMEGIQSTAESTIENQPEPKPILRLDEAVINRIAAGEVSPFLIADLSSPPIGVRIAHIGLIIPPFPFL